MNNKKTDDTQNTQDDYTTDNHSRKISQGWIDKLLDVQDRDSALKKIHREDVEYKQQKYSGDNDVGNEFEHYIFEKIIDDDYTEDDETDKEITNKIAEIVHECFGGIYSFKESTVGRDKDDLFYQ